MQKKSLYRKVNLEIVFTRKVPAGALRVIFPRNEGKWTKVNCPRHEGSLPQRKDNYKIHFLVNPSLRRWYVDASAKLVLYFRRLCWHFSLWFFYIYIGKVVKTLWESRFQRWPTRIATPWWRAHFASSWKYDQPHSYKLSKTPLKCPSHLEKLQWLICKVYAPS